METLQEDPVWVLNFPFNLTTKTEEQMLQGINVGCNRRNAKALGVRKHKDASAKSKKLLFFGFSENKLFIISLFTKLFRKRLRINSREGLTSLKNVFPYKMVF